MAKKPTEPVDEMRVEAQRVIVEFLKRREPDHSQGLRDRVDVALDVLKLPK